VQRYGGVFSRAIPQMWYFHVNCARMKVELKAESKWGDSIIKSISRDLQDKFPGIKGFSETNIDYMKRFYTLYSHIAAISPQPVGELNDVPAISPQVGGELFQIPWGHHRYIMDKLRENPEKALFFVRKTAENGWSRAVLLNFLHTDLYERQGKAISNFKSTLPTVQSDLAQEITKDPYNFDFLAITEPYREKELKDALVQNITRFLLELGTGFAYIGREYRLQIGQTEKFIDMLFYNLNLRCYVVIEIKVKEFDSDNVGQLGTYITAVNHILKRPEDNPTIGLLVCKTKDNILAQYALESSNQPIGISEYELTKLYPTNFKGTLPSIEDIENELKDDLNS
jgi:predicted nuclease of restriction endonuclease-like (RecB) superfamily